MEMLIAGALWREERVMDKLALIRMELRAPYVKSETPLSYRDFLKGRDVGESWVPGYRSSDA